MLRRSLLTPAVAAPLGLLGGCGWLQDVANDGADAPASAPLARPAHTAWVLSSGGPRGFAHVGVLKALTELGYRPDLIVGASIGALVGCLYASGLPPHELEKLALEFSFMGVVRPNLAGPGNEKISGGGIVGLVNELVNRRMIEQLPTGMAVVAMQQKTREVVAFTRGNLGVAVQASCAIEGNLAPVQIRGHAYVDPDLGTPMPVRVALALGAQYVLAVDVSAHETKAPTGSERYRAGDLRKRALTEPEAKAATFTLHPEFSYYVSLSQEFRERAIHAGYTQTMARAAQLKAAFPRG